MKQAVFSLVGLLLAYASAQVQPSLTFNDTVKECDEKYPVSKELKDFVLNAVELPLDLPEPARCNIKCVAEKEGFINSAGSYDIEKSVPLVKEGFKLSDEKTEECRKYFEECNKVGTDYKGNEPCMSSFLTARCLQMKLVSLVPKKD